MSLNTHTVSVMDGTLHEYLQLAPAEAMIKIKEILQISNQYKGEFIALWHNETISNHKKWANWKEKVFEVLVDRLQKHRQMIKYIKHQDIDKDKWNECVWNSPNGLAYVFTWYLDIVAQEWDALVEDNYISVFPLPIKKVRNFVYLSTFLGSTVRFILKNSYYTRKSLQFLKHIPSHIRFIDYNLNNLQKLPENHSFEQFQTITTNLI